MTYVIIWAVSNGFLTCANAISTKKTGEDVLNGLGDGEALLVLALAPFFAVSVLSAKVFEVVWRGATYFTAEKRHQRKLKAAERERELWEAKNGMSLDDVDRLLEEDMHQDLSLDALDLEEEVPDE